MSINKSSSSSNATPTPPHSPPHLAAGSSSSVPGLRSAMKHSSSSRHGSRPTTPVLPPSPNAKPTFSRDVSSASTAVPMTLAIPSTSSTGYTPKVSFDTFENLRDQAMFSYTLQVKTENYSRNGNTRVFLCAASGDESGSSCLEWVIESLVQDSDELIVLRGFDSDILGTQQDAVRQEARDLMTYLQTKCLAIDPSRQLSMVVEFVAGSVTKTIERLIALYRPDSLIVGTRGQRGIIQTWGQKFQKFGSVSKWCLSHSPVPVIVVRPERKVKKAMEKRRNDPKRGQLFGDSPKSPGPGVGSLPLTKSIQ